MTTCCVSSPSCTRRGMTPLHGSEHALASHTDRQAALEEEDLRRNPAREVDVGRLRPDDR
jgi:hypothetical protein